MASMGSYLKTTAKWLIKLFILIHLVIAFPILLNLLGVFGTYQYSYVSKIRTPSYGNFHTKKVLDKFNKLGDNKAVMKDGYRPIYIVEGDLTPGAVGVAYRLPLYCVIVVERNMPYYIYDQVLLHEYVHCFGYGHVEDDKDLMNAYVSPYFDEKSIEKYAKEIKERFYE